MISFNRECISCETNNLFKIEKITEKSIIKFEHNFNFNNKNRRAVIAYLENDKIKYIFEICDTNKTDENNRPNMV